MAVDIWEGSDVFMWMAGGKVSRAFTRIHGDLQIVNKKKLFIAMI